MNEQKNFLLAMVLSGFVLMGYWFFVGQPTAEKARLDAQAEAAKIETQNPQRAIDPPVIKERSQAIATGTRIKIDTPSITGSLLTTGFRLDDVSLKTYNKTLNPDDGLVDLLSPEGTQRAAYITDNWIPANGGTGINTPWQLVSGDILTPTSPITLQHNVDDIQISRLVTIDEKFLLTITDTLTNTGGGEAVAQRYGITRQHGLADDLTNFFIIQEGPISVTGGKYHEYKYKKTAKKGGWSDTGESGWVGLTDKYWLQAAIGPQGKQMRAEYAFRTINDQDVYEASYLTDQTILTAGASITSTAYMFAGAKERETLKTYEEDLGISSMYNAIGWGRLKILVKPISWALAELGKLIGNYGIAILILTFLIKLIMFPLFNKQYASQAKMKKVVPKTKILQERYKDDRVKLQQEMMALYKKEGVNPAAGCLPLIPNIFVFFALYKAVFIDIDLRHAPFFGYIRDLSAADPLSILNGFGALPWDNIPLQWLTLLAIGPLAIIYGVSMAMTMMLSTPPAAGASEQAAMQAKIFKWMPWVFMFIIARFPAALLIYWTWNNVLSFIQQYVITRKNGVTTPIDKWVNKIFGKGKTHMASNDE
ncbi:MAG: membrane protein insertase YidC [Litorimonas sp.]